jgi:hypothetical protein
MTLNEFFFNFVKSELTPLEQKAFIDGKKQLSFEDMTRYHKPNVIAGIGCYFHKNGLLNRMPYISFKYLQTFMQGFLKETSGVIIGRYNIKNKYIEQMGYEIPKNMSFKKFHENLYIKKWKKYVLDYKNGKFGNVDTHFLRRYKSFDYYKRYGENSGI